MGGEPRFLLTEQVLNLHERTLMLHGGLAGVRDLGLLEAALAMPRQKFAGEYLHTDLGAMAAAYLFHIASNHPFNDGNKRVAVMCALVLLQANGADCWPEEEPMEALTLAVAEGKLTKPELIDWFRNQVSHEP